MKTADELWKLWHQARALPYGSAQIALVEQLLRHVDGAGDPQLAFLTRLFGTTAYVYGGEPAKAFVTFSWCVADFDNNPSDYHQSLQHNLLWQFKSMVSALTRFPEVSLERTEAVLDDMERRYRESGRGMQAVYKHRYLVADHVGRADEAAEWFAKWQATPRDTLSDCAGCDPTDVADYLATRGRYADAVAVADPVLAGEPACNEQPQRMLTVLMTPYLQVGRPDDAADAHRRAYRLQRSNVADLGDIGQHIAFCARSGNEHRGLEILQRHLDWLAKPASPAAAMDFAAAGALLLRRLTDQGHGDLTLSRAAAADPAASGSDGAAGSRIEVTAAELAVELTAHATELAAQFDARNGTDRVGRRIGEALAAQPFETVLNLSPSARRLPPSARADSADGRATAELPKGTAAELLELAGEHYRSDRFEAFAAVLEALDARLKELTDPLLLARRAVHRANQLRMAGAGDGHELWNEALKGFDAAGAAVEASAIRARIALDRAANGDEDEEPIRSDVAYCEEHGDPAEKAAAWARFALLHLIRERWEKANEAGDRGDAYAAMTGDARLVAAHALQRARHRVAADQKDEAWTAAQEAFAFYQEHGPARGRAEAASLGGHLAEDEEERAELFGIAIAAGDPGSLMGARIGRANALRALGRSGDAIDDLVEVVALCAEQDLEEGGGLARLELAEAYAEAGRPVEAAEVAEEAILILDRTDKADAANTARYLLARQYRELGDRSGAAAALLALTERMPDDAIGRGQLGEEAGELLFEADRDAEAAEVLRVAAAARRAGGDLVGELRVLRRWIAALHFAGRPAEAEEVMRLADDRWAALPKDHAEQPEAVWQHGMIAFEAGRVLMSVGRHADALPYLRGADVPLRVIGADDDADRLSGMYGEALLRSGAVAEAEAHLRELLAVMLPEAAGREQTEKIYAEVLESRGQS